MALRATTITMRNLERWLQEHTVDDILRAHNQAQAVYTVKKSTKLADCLNTFRQHRIAHLMVRDCATLELRWLRLEDLIRHVHEEGLLDDKVEKSNNLMEACCVTPSDSIWNVIKNWPHNDSDMPPLAVVDTGANVVGVVTTTDVIHYLYLYGCHLSYIMDKPTAIIPCEPLVNLFHREERAEKCLCALLSPDSSGVIGIVDRKGILVGDVTIGAFVNTEEDLDLPILHYLRTINHESPLLQINMQHCYGDTLKRFLIKKVHHAWKLNEYGRPIGVLHASNLIKFLAQQVNIY